MSELVVIRKAQTSDSPGMAEVHVRAWQAAYRGQMPEEFLDALDVEQRMGMWEAFLERGPSDTSLFVADVNGRIAGWILVGSSRDDPFRAPMPDAAADDPAAGEVFAINLHPDFFRKGIGTRLMDRGVEQLRSSGFRSVILWVLDGNERARKFYERLGWADDGARKTGNFGGAELVELRYRMRFD